MSDDITSDFESSLVKNKKKEAKSRKNGIKTKTRKLITESESDNETEKGPKNIKQDVSKNNKSKRKLLSSDDDEDNFKPSEFKSKKIKKETSLTSIKEKEEHILASIKPKGEENDKKKLNNDNEIKKARRKKTETEKEDVWKWWEEMPHPDGIYWTKLEHNGPYFSPPYEPLPDNVKFYYDKKPFKLSVVSEEIASFYAKMLLHEYTSKDIFNQNFFNDWRSFMNTKEKNTILDLNKCDFKEMNDYYKQEQEKRKDMSKEEKQKLKDANNLISEKYGVCYVDGHKQKVGNFRIEPPGLFRGRGNHPKQGKLKLRVQPEDVTLNLSQCASIPEPPIGHKWKGIVHENKVTWLAQWIENVSGSYKYVMLNATARTKGTKDMSKYDIARGLHNCIHTIRSNYLTDMSSKEMKMRQRAVALYFIDRLALRAGHEKEDGESADTVGCCSLRVEHIKLERDLEKKEYVVNFDFLGKDSVRYVNRVIVEKKVFKNLKIFMKNKNGEDDLFDRLTTSSLNKYLGELMDGLSAKVFRTYNASTTLQDQLNILTESKMNINDKLLAYNRANRAVALLCNHQRSVPKTFDKTMENLNEKIKNKKKQMKTIKADVKAFKSASNVDKNKLELKKKQLKRIKEQYHKLKISVTDKEENKEVALGTSKLNYLDPRISVAWCKKHDIPIDKIYNKALREKFQWAMDMTDSNFIF